VVYQPVNACILLLGQVDGAEVITVEDLAEGGNLHPVQAAMVGYHGSQCGFCTPGIVMSLFALSHSGKAVDRGSVTQALAGNLCRCTGYRPIVEAALNACIRLINERFPFVGSKIDWTSVSGSIVEKLSSTDEILQCKAFMSSCLRGMDGKSPVVVVGDGLMNFQIETTISGIAYCLDDVLGLPQHTYITSPLCEWCLVFTMEGDMCFGNAPAPK
jgi:hypothetical protein